MPNLIGYSLIEIKRATSLIINSVVFSKISDNIKDDLIIITEDANKNIISIDINQKLANQILTEVSSTLEKNLNYVENSELQKLTTNSIKADIYYIPSGFIFNNSLLNNILPKIPVKINYIGNVFSKLTTSLDSYGINNTLMKINIEVEVEVKVVLPFMSESTKINSSIPIVIKLIEGKVPAYYGNIGTPYTSTTLD